MSRYCVIGSGISGATIANLLSEKNSVELWDKAKGPGGRSSFKRLGKAKGFDHGTQYISPKSLAFKRFAIVAPEIPEPITQYLLIYQRLSYHQSSW